MSWSLECYLEENERHIRVILFIFRKSDHEMRGKVFQEQKNRRPGLRKPLSEDK
jgi:hypothetical protein